MNLPPVLANFLDSQAAWTQSNIAQNPGSDYWAQAELVQGQVMGVYEGYSLAAPASQALGYNDIWFLNIGNDIEDLEAAFNISGECWPEDAFVAPLLAWFLEMLVAQMMRLRCSLSLSSLSPLSIPLTRRRGVAEP